MEALADPEDYYGGTLPDVTITCDTGGSGRCYALRVEEGLYGACRFYCTFTGDQNNSCSQLWVDIVNFCSALSA